MNNKETVETWNNIARIYQDKFMNLDIYNFTYDAICSNITFPNAKLLEIGCGPGNISKYLLNKRPDFEITGIDIAPNMIELAKSNNPTAHFMVMDTRDIHQLESKFDGIIGGFCLPYLNQSECNNLIEQASYLLFENGLLYLSFVEGEPSKSEYKIGIGGRVFFNYHNLEHVIEILSNSNFEGIEIDRVQFKKTENDFDIHTIVRAKKK